MGSSIAYHNGIKECEGERKKGKEKRRSEEF